MTECMDERDLNMVKATVATMDDSSIIANLERQVGELKDENNRITELIVTGFNDHFLCCPGKIGLKNTYSRQECGKADCKHCWREALK